MPCWINLSGILYIVATPIGNLNDISNRALSILKEVHLIAAEDTRITKNLLNKYQINNKLISYNNFNENNIYVKIVDLLLDGENIALVSDAGTPLISDPGYRLVNYALQKKIQVLSIPGPSSAIAALSISGLPTDKFYFEGFLPKKKGRQTRFLFLSSMDATIIIYESPKRLLKTINNIIDFMGDRIISVVKEITKIHESVCLGRASNVIELFDTKNLRGEFIILVAKKGYQINE